MRKMTYKADYLAGTDMVIETHPAWIFRILPSGQHILVTHVVGSLINHPGAALHTNRVAAAQVGVKV